LAGSKNILRKPSFIFSVSWLILNLLLAIFAYYIISDDTRNANTHIPELALKEPGYKALTFVYSIPKSEQSYFSKKFLGSTESRTIIPIQSYKIQAGEGIRLEKLNGGDLFISMDADYKFDNPIKYMTFWFGTDKYGRDIFSRVVLGLRISFIVGLISVTISIFLGILLGLIAGYFGGLADKIIMFLINSFWSVPTVLLVFAIVIGFGRSITVIFIAVGLTMWIEVARLVRGMVLQTKQKTYISAAESLGLGKNSILLKHILPNIIGPVTVLIAANFAIAILIEAGLSYLGFGVQLPTPSLGNLLNENYGYALSGKIYMALIPALAIMLLVLSFNLIGNTLSNIFEKDLSLKQLQIKSLLTITQAINDNIPAEGLFNMYKSFLSWEMGIEHMVLFVKNNNTEKWEAPTSINVDQSMIKVLIPLILPYNRLYTIKTEDPKELQNFDVIIPVYHKESSIAYALIGGIRDKDDLYNKIQFITTITNIIAVAIENKRLFKQQMSQVRLQREMELASEVQHMLIPSEVPISKYFEMDTVYLPNLNVGGDYLDYVKLDEHKYAMCIADISGKGVAAALLMANFQAMLQSLIYQFRDLETFVFALNESVYKITKSDKFITFFIAEIDFQEKKMRQS